MGDLSNEPSMEEILSSIKRIIAEEGDAAPRIRRAGRPVPAAEPESGEVLELNDPMPTERAPIESAVAENAPADRVAADRVPSERPIGERPGASVRIRPDRIPSPAREKDDDRAPPPVAAESPSKPASAAPEPRATAEPVLSQGTVDATRGALDHLSKMLVRPDAGSDGTLEGLVREMIRPMLRDWLDANLPSLVEDMVAREIGRITGSRR